MLCANRFVTFPVFAGVDLHIFGSKNPVVEVLKVADGDGVDVGGCVEVQMAGDILPLVALPVSVLVIGTAEFAVAECLFAAAAVCRALSAVLRVDFGQLTDSFVIQDVFLVSDRNHAVVAKFSVNV